MSTSEKLTEKIKNFKHKEIVLFVIIIVVVVLLWLFIKNPTKTTSVISYTDMTTKEELTFRITEAVNALSGDSQSKIVIYWDNEAIESNNSFSSLLGGSNSENNDINTSISGIAVVCKNGDDATTKVKITFMLSKVFDIKADRISVYGKK